MADKKKKGEGASEYIEKVIDNKNLEKELEITGGKYKIPTTPPIGKDTGDNTTNDKSKKK